jgi:hypothetical protein
VVKPNAFGHENSMQRVCSAAVYLIDDHQRLAHRHWRRDLREIDQRPGRRVRVNDDERLRASRNARARGRRNAERRRRGSEMKMDWVRVA